MPYLGILRAWLPAGLCLDWLRRALQWAQAESKILCAKLWNLNVSLLHSDHLPQQHILMHCASVTLSDNNCGNDEGAKCRWTMLNPSTSQHNFWLLGKTLFKHCTCPGNHFRRVLNNVLSRKLVVASLIFFMFFSCFSKGCGAVQLPNPQFVMHTLIWIHFFQRSTQLLPT